MTDEKIALVTGGGSGIGRAVAHRLADDGWRVVVSGRSESRLAEAKSAYRGAGRIDARAVDVGDASAAAGLVDFVESQVGPIGLLVNNAGVNAKARSLAELTVEEWNRQVQINLTGAYLMIHALLPHMRSRRDGVIVNVTSISGARPTPLAGAAYSASKAGLDALTSVVAQEEGKSGIRCTAISPGEVETPILEVRPEPVTAERRAVILQPEDVAAAVAFVASLPPRAHVPRLVIKPTVHSYQ